MLLAASSSKVACALEANNATGEGIKFSEQVKPAGKETSKTNRLHQDFSVHPILGIKIGTKFAGSLSKEDCKKLREAGCDPNYLGFEAAEKEAAITFCKMATAGKLDLLDCYVPPNGPRNEHLAIGFNQIPVLLAFENQKCVSAVILPVSRYNEHMESPYIGADNAGILRHFVFDTVEFQGLNSRQPTDWEFRSLNADPGYRSFAEVEHILFSNCFDRIEAEAALQFRQRVLGMRKDKLKELFGKPSVTAGSITPWEKSPDTFTNWLYYLGYSSVPVRLLFDGDCCVGASVLSNKQHSDYQHLLMTRFGEHTSGKTEAEIIRRHGPPQEIKEDLFGQRLLIYGIDKDMCSELSIRNGRVSGPIPMMVLMGWKHRDNF